jgi:sugar transferase EpsL
MSQHSFYSQFGKRLMDLAVTIPLLLLVSPLLLIIWLCVVIVIGKPPLFRQERPGLHGRSFTIYKFRTMHDYTDASGVLLPDDERLTRFGSFLRRTSMDELPELWNVLSGDMSMVGPRPLLPQYLPRYSQEQKRRHDVKPGITGWAQINGRNSLTWDEKFDLDVWYARHASLFLDIGILLATPVRVFTGDGINHDGHATMPEFLETHSRNARED